MPKRKDLPSSVTPEDFTKWIKSNFTSVNEAERILGLYRDTLHALSTGGTRRGSPYPAAPWVYYMMVGYSHARASRGGRKINIDLQAAQELIDSGMSIDDVALKCQCSRATIRYHIIRGRLTYEPWSNVSNRRIFDVGEVEKMLEDGLSARDISVKIGVSRNAIYTAVYEGRVKRPGKAKFTPRFDVKAAQSILDQGGSIKDAAKMAKTSYAAIARQVRNGVLIKKEVQQ